MNISKPQEIPVVAAIIQRGDRVLIAQRPPGKALAMKWEFPGGKVEPGETEAHAILREIREELGCEIIVETPLPSFVHHYPHASIRMIPMLATLAPGALEPHPHEHIAIDWVRIPELRSRDLAEADIPLLVTLEERNTLARPTP